MNRGKSSIVGLNCCPAKLSYWASLVGSEEWQFLSSHIGLPLGELDALWSNVILKRKDRHPSNWVASLVVWDFVKYSGTLNAYGFHHTTAIVAGIDGIPVRIWIFVGFVADAVAAIEIRSVPRMTFGNLKHELFFQCVYDDSGHVESCQLPRSQHSQATQLYKLTLQVYHCHDRFSCRKTCREEETYTITRMDPTVAIVVNPPTMAFQFSSPRTL
ncbi:hypothetical protein E6C27_scaffold506G00060 [Cucumis melo var. makuwa]|uniref:Uncharacterized protein n=1 Tax=Cucumis melo var. makuwa TaxID=1194695 RepID=A0A5A7SRI1_CUCMM|nr:hypothetical protein E6C27_scaffold506G00060 [Cucumis melo var. makuwa]